MLAAVKRGLAWYLISLLFFLSAKASAETGTDRVDLWLSLGFIAMSLGFCASIFDGDRNYRE